MLSAKAKQTLREKIGETRAGKMSHWLEKFLYDHAMHVNKVQKDCASCKDDSPAANLAKIRDYLEEIGVEQLICKDE